MDIINWGEVQQLLTGLGRFPVLIVLLGGMLFGVLATQMIKLWWLAYESNLVPTSRAKYQANVRMLAFVCTFAFTALLWANMMGHTALGLIVSAGSAFGAPLGYSLVKKYARKFLGDDFVAGWGDPEPPK